MTEDQVQAVVDAVLENLGGRKGFDNLFDEIQDAAPETWDDLVGSCREVALKAANAFEPEYQLAGYFRFVESDTPGVVGEIRSTYKPHYADPSDIPFYRKKGETKRSLDMKGVLEALPARGRI